MTLTNILDSLTDWCNREICPKVNLKLPDDEKIGPDAELVHPTAFALFIPGKDRLPPQVRAPIPSICVQFVEGEDKLVEGKRTIALRLCLSCWNPGKQSGGVFKNVRREGDDFPHYTQGDDTRYYLRSLDGWKDIWNFADTVIRIVEGSEFISGLRLVKEEAIKFGPFTEDGQIWDYYPYWHSWVSFKLEAGTTAAIPQTYKEFL